MLQSIMGSANSWRVGSGTMSNVTWRTPGIVSINGEQIRLSGTLRDVARSINDVQYRTGVTATVRNNTLILKTQGKITIIDRENVLPKELIESGTVQIINASGCDRAIVNYVGQSKTTATKLIVQNGGGNYSNLFSSADKPQQSQMSFGLSSRHQFRLRDDQYRNQDTPKITLKRSGDDSFKAAHQSRDKDYSEWSIHSHSGKDEFSDDDALDINEELGQQDGGDTAMNLSRADLDVSYRRASGDQWHIEREQLLKTLSEAQAETAALRSELQKGSVNFRANRPPSLSCEEDLQVEEVKSPEIDKRSKVVRADTSLAKQLVSFGGAQHQALLQHTPKASALAIPYSSKDPRQKNPVYPHYLSLDKKKQEKLITDMVHKISNALKITKLTKAGALERYKNDTQELCSMYYKFTVGINDIGISIDNISSNAKSRNEINSKQLCALSTLMQQLGF